MTEKTTEKLAVVHFCGGDKCPAGGEHQWDAWASLGTYENGRSMGESKACSKCGLTAFDRDLLEAE